MDLDLSEPVRDLFSSAPDPAINPRLPANQKSLATQINNPNVQALLSRYPGIKDSYLNYQGNRVNVQGLAPKSTPDILPALAAAGQSKSITPEPQGNIVQNFASDATNLAQSIWKLPFALVGEGRTLVDAPDAISTALSTSNNPLEAIGSLSQTPGLRLIPGSYIASGLRPGSSGFLQNLADHPLYSALDVLPYASRAASASKTVTAARNAASEATKFAAANDLLPAASKVNPISTFVKNYHPGTGPVLDSAGNLTRNKFGQALLTTKDALASTHIGKPLTKAFSSDSRSIARAANRAYADIVQGFRGQFAEGSFEQAARDTLKSLDSETAKLSTSERAGLSSALRTGDTSSLSPSQLAVHESYKSNLDALTQSAVDSGDLTSVQFPHGTEIYPTKTGQLILDRRSNAKSWADLLNESYINIPEATPALQSLNDAITAQNWQAAQLAITDLQKSHALDSIPYAKARREFQKVINTEAHALPARWDTVVKNNLADKISATHNLTPEQASALSAGLWSQVLGPESLQAEIASVKKSWQEIANNTPADQQPLYVHNVAPEKVARALSAPQFFDYTPSVSSLKSRMFDSAGTVLDAQISLRHQALEVLQRSVWADTVDRIIRTFGKTESQLQSQYLESMGSQLDSNPLIDAKSALSKEINRKYSPFDPDKFLNPSKSSAKLSGLNPNTIYLPNEVVSTLNELKSQTRGQLARATDPLMRVFRTSVLTLSPRYYLNNVFGNSVMTLLNAKNPATVARYTKDAWALTRHPDDLVNLTLPKSKQSLTFSRNEVRDLQPRLPELSGLQQAISSIDASDPAAVASFYQQTQAGKALYKLANNTAMESLRRGNVKIQQFGAQFNSVIDDIATTTNFLEGLDHSLTKGLSRDEAINAGVTQARRAFETWDTLTPTERSVIRSIFPFYGFTRNLLKFVLQYPATHPLRLSILSSFAKAEETDFGTGLPQQLSQYLYLSPLDSKGRVTAFAPGGINPFQDVGAYASLLGFLAGGSGDLSAITKNLNPLLSTALTELGVDPTRGSGDIYPDLYLDPNTGQLAAKTGNPLYDLASSTVPQSRILTNLLGLNQNFSNTLRTNPEAAGRQLLSAAGLPTYARTVDLTESRIKSELTRRKASKDELKTALSSGNWDIANRYPSLRPLIEKLKSLPPEKLEQYQLSSGEAGILEAAKRGVAGTR